MNNQCIPDYCPIVTNNKAVDCQAFISVGKIIVMDIRIKNVGIN